MHIAPRDWFRGTLGLAKFTPQENRLQAHKDFISCDREGEHEGLLFCLSCMHRDHPSGTARISVAATVM